MFKNRLIPILIGILSASPVMWAQDSTALISVEATIDTTRLENALLWKISRSDIPAESYLFGTVHLIQADDFFLPSGTELAMEKAEKFVFEIDMAEMTDMSAQFSLIMKAFMQNGVKLRDLMSQEDYQLVADHFEKMGLPMMMLERVKPMFLMMFASEDMDMNSMSSGEMLSYEMEFYDFAVEREKPTGGLETMEFQLSVFDSIPYKVQAEMLVETIREGSDGGDAMDEIMELYRTQNIEDLYAGAIDDQSEASQYEDILIKDRNVRWIHGILEYMQQGPTFFAVGAGHLGGPDGVIRLLRKAGFTVLPVSHVESREMKKF